MLRCRSKNPQHLKICWGFLFVNCKLWYACYTYHTKDSCGSDSVVFVRHLGLDKSSYSKPEKNTREVKVSELKKLSSLFSMPIDLIINYDGDIPTEVNFEDKAAQEQLKLMAQLNDKDKNIVMEIINTMLTKQKFNDFFQENIQK